jgi:hypothetical protein
MALTGPRVFGPRSGPIGTAELTYILPDQSVTGWLVADGTGTWATPPPTTWLARAVWAAAQKSPISYVREIDIGVRTSFVPLVSVTVDGTPLIEESHSDDILAWSAYAVIGPQVIARYIRIRVTVTGSYPKIKTMRTILSAKPITEIIEDQNSALLVGAYRIGVGDIRLPITKVYNAIKKIGITAQSVGPGFTWEQIDSDTTVGPRVKFYVGGVATDIVFDADVSGV